MIFSVLTYVALMGCAGAQVDSRPTGAPDRSAELAEETRAVIRADPTIPSILSQTAFANGVRWNATTGAADASNQPFRIASVAKLMTAAVVLGLVEEKRIVLDQPATAYLPPATMNGLCVVNGVDRSSEITVRQLLAHRSGLADYFFDGPADSGLTPFLNLLASSPDRMWSPGEPVQWVRDNLPAISAPGTTFHYSDTNYQLLGLIIQRVTGRPLATVYREKLFVPAQMKATYLEWHENPVSPDKPLPMNLGPINLDTWRSLSSDWGGGGIVSTLDDVARFLRALFAGRFFRQASTLGLMQPAKGEEYGLGMQRVSVGGRTLLGHEGAYGVWAFYDPQWQVTFVGSVNQVTAEESAQRMLERQVSLVRP
jgi:CubicO group peptidase (beta-lactamase class C family)